MISKVSEQKKTKFYYQHTEETMLSMRRVMICLGKLVVERTDC